MVDKWGHVVQIAGKFVKTLTMAIFIIQRLRLFNLPMLIYVRRGIGNLI